MVSYLFDILLIQAPYCICTTPNSQLPGKGVHKSGIAFSNFIYFKLTVTSARL